eukprot:79847-Heterocapsa_arctica.AAC.1
MGSAKGTGGRHWSRRNMCPADGSNGTSTNTATTGTTEDAGTRGVRRPRAPATCRPRWSSTGAATSAGKGKVRGT